MGRLTQSTEEIQKILDQAKSGTGANWDAKKGEAGYVENRPFGFNQIIRLSDADEITVETIDEDYDRKRVTYKFKNSTFEYGLYFYRRTRAYDSSLTYYSDNIVKTEPEEYFSVLDFVESAILHIEFNDYNDDGDYETIITLEGDYLDRSSFEANLYLCDGITSLRSAMPEIYLPESAARQEQIDELYEEVHTVWENVGDWWEIDELMVREYDLTYDISPDEMARMGFTDEFFAAVTTMRGVKFLNKDTGVSLYLPIAYFDMLPDGTSSVWSFGMACGSKGILLELWFYKGIGEYGIQLTEV